SRASRTVSARTASALEGQAARGLVGAGNSAGSEVVETMAMMYVALVFASIGLPPANSAASRPAFELATLSQIDQQFLMQTARRAFDAAILGNTPLISSYRPATLRGRRARASVTLRWHGRVVAQATSGEVDMLDATRTAAESAAAATTRPIEKSAEALAQ